jgi:hypothetical protein
LSLTLYERLEFNVKQGWAPLAQFLKKAVPIEPFPRLNDAEALANVFMILKIGVLTWPLILMLLLNGLGRVVKLVARRVF